MPHNVFSKPALSALAAMMLLSGSALAQNNQIPTTPTTQPGSNPPARKLTLEEAVSIALQNSKSLRISAEGVVKARGRVLENRAGYLPSFSSDVTFTHLDEGSSFVLQQDGQTIVVPLVKQDQKAVGISALLPVDIVGQIGAAVRLAEFQEIS